MVSSDSNRSCGVGSAGDAMITFAPAGSLGREALEAQFIGTHCPWAASWALSRSGRTSTWTSGQGRRRVVVTLVPHEYKAHPSDAGGLWGEAIEWDQTVLRLGPDGTWHATPQRLRGKPTLTKKFRRSA